MLTLDIVKTIAIMVCCFQHDRVIASDFNNQKLWPHSDHFRAKFPSAHNLLIFCQREFPEQSYEPNWKELNLLLLYFLLICIYEMNYEL